MLHSCCSCARNRGSAPQATCAGSLCGATNTALLAAVGIVDQLRVVVENHGRNLLDAERGPLRHLRVIGIACTCKVDPRVAHDVGKRPRIRTAPRHALAAVGVVEREGDFGTMEGAWPAVQNGSLPREPIQIS